MDSRKVKIKQKTDQGNHFNRITEDLLLFILSKIDDAKSLSQCSLVSRRFGSTISLIKTVSLSLPSTRTSTTESANDMRTLLKSIPRLKVEEINRFILSSSLKWLNFILLLQKFRLLKSISLKFTCPANLCSLSLFDLKVRFRDSGAALFERIITIVPARVYKVNDQGYRANHFSDTFCTTQETLGCCAEWVVVLCLLVKCNPSLESIVITSSNKPWTFVLKDKPLVAMRNGMFPGGSILDSMKPAEKKAKTGVMPELRLPISGYVMQGVRFSIEYMNLPSHSGSSRECNACKNEISKSLCDDGKTWVFVGDRKMINEAVHEILDKFVRNA